MTRKKASIITTITAFILVFSLALSVSAAPSPYEHDPMDNPKAAEDIIENPDAVYGFSPNPESVRLKEYVDYDWTDPAFVSEMKQQREEYHESIKELYQMKASMEAAGDSTEEIARAISTRRNEIRLESYKDDPEGLEKVKKSNLDTFGNENGGTPDYFYEKYGSWDTVIEKALSSNPGADAILGLYDEYYDTYIIDSYVVKTGDCLCAIARKMLGDEALWKTIFDLNTDQIRDPDLIYPGQVLKLR